MPIGAASLQVVLALLHYLRLIVLRLLKLSRRCLIAATAIVPSLAIILRRSRYRQLGQLLYIPHLLRRQSCVRDHLVPLLVILLIRILSGFEVALHWVDGFYLLVPELTADAFSLIDVDHISDIHILYHLIPFLDLLFGHLGVTARRAVLTLRPRHLRDGGPLLLLIQEVLRFVHRCAVDAARELHFPAALRLQKERWFLQFILVVLMELLRLDLLQVVPKIAMLRVLALKYCVRGHHLLLAIIQHLQ